MKNALKFTGLFLGLTVNAIAFAKSLQEYRKTIPAAEQTNGVSELPAQIMELLGIKNADLSRIAPPNGVVGNSRRNNSSILIKRHMHKGIERLVEEEKMGPGVIFTPSSTLDVEDALEAKRQWQISICRQVYPRANQRRKEGEALQEGSLDHLLNEILELSNAPAENKENAIVPNTTLRAYLKSNQQLEKGRGVEDVLGRLDGLQITDGSISGIKFIRQSGESTVVTLSMMATFLAGEDDAFIAMLDCLIDEADAVLQVSVEAIERHKSLSGPVDSIRTFFNSDRSEEAKKIDITLHKANRERFTKIKAYLEPRLQAARQLNALLKQLDSNAQRDLMHVLLRAQIQEIPSGLEMNALNRSIGNIINQAVNARDDATVKMALVDSGYFTDISKQLARVRDSLEQQNQQRLATQRISEELRGVKK